MTFGDMNSYAILNPYDVPYHQFKVCPMNSKTPSRVYHVLLVWPEYNRTKHDLKKKNRIDKRDEKKM